MQAEIELRLDSGDDFVVEAERSKTAKHTICSTIGVSDNGDGTKVNIITEAGSENQKVAYKLMELGVKMLVEDRLIAAEADAMIRAREDK